MSATRSSATVNAISARNAVGRRRIEKNDIDHLLASRRQGRELLTFGDVYV
jgi:hypothetical protein